MSGVLVLGGRGFMGRRIARLLHQQLPDLEVLTGGRGSGNDRRVDVLAPEDDYAALRDVDVVINTVGPFDYDRAPIMSACGDTETHYVDIAETVASDTPGETCGTYRSLSSLRGRGRPCHACIIGCSTVPGLIDVLAQKWHGKRIRAQLSIGTNNPASAALLFSMLRPVGQARPHGGRYFNHTWARKHAGLPPRRYGPYPGGWFQFGFGFDRRIYTRVLSMLAPLIAGTPDWLLKPVSAVGSALSLLARPFGTKIGILSVDALDDTGEVIGSIEVRAHENGLDVPSWPSVWATELLLKHPQAVTSLSELMSADDAVKRLRDAGFDVHE